MSRSTSTIGSDKSQQFTIQRIETVFNLHKPKPPLAKFVDTFWLYEADATTENVERILPTGTLELAINLRQDELSFYELEHPEKCAHFSGAVISGAHGRGFAPLNREAFIIGVHFKPGGAFPFLGLPADELANTHIDLQTLWGTAADRLRSQLCEAKTHEERFQFLEKALLTRLSYGIEQHYAVSAALQMFLQNQVGPSVRETAKYLSLSQRRFIEAFKTEVGLTPKLFSRIQRFQRARTSIQLNPLLDWATLALDLGYFDQSHLIREFLEFSGLSPSDYRYEQRRHMDQTQ